MSVFYSAYAETMKKCTYESHSTLHVYWIKIGPTSTESKLVSD